METTQNVTASDQHFFVGPRDREDPLKTPHHFCQKIQIAEPPNLNIIQKVFLK